MNKTRTQLLPRLPTASGLAVMTFALMMLSAGCAILKPAKNESHYYLLTPTMPKAANVQTHPGAHALLLRLRPIDMADYLNNEGMAVRLATNEISFALFHRWAEPLDAGIRRVLTENLRAAPGVSEVLTDERAPTEAAVYTVSIHVLACEGRLASNQGSATFQAAWEITGPDPGDNLLMHGNFVANPAAWKHGDYEDLAAQLSRDLGEFSTSLLNALHQTAAASQ